jgi:parallel beta-helix repeat protein
MRTTAVLATLLATLAALAASPSLAAEPLFYDKAFITKDTTWSGTVILRGQNVVHRGITLTVEPGTVVKFEWIDDDHNDIGDGELTVEGTLISKGTKEKPILYTSAQPNPRMRDWTFVQISVSKNSVVEHSIFEYGFSGLQVHYSKSEVRDSLFRYNYEGIRFSTTDVLIEHNDFIENFYGIRTEANGSRTTIRNNRFKGNEHAYFPVRKTGSTVKFFDNNIEDSVQYNVNFGQNQAESLDLTNNWWGTTDREKIVEKFYDKTKDKSLGAVIFEPFLTKPVEDCGMR